VTRDLFANARRTEVAAVGLDDGCEVFVGVEGVGDGGEAEDVGDLV
jgi:hypothetical protein